MILFSSVFTLQEFSLWRKTIFVIRNLSRKNHLVINLIVCMKFFSLIDKTKWKDEENPERVFDSLKVNYSLRWCFHSTRYDWRWFVFCELHFIFCLMTLCKSSVTEDFFLSSFQLKGEDKSSGMFTETAGIFVGKNATKRFLFSLKTSFERNDAWLESHSVNRGDSAKRRAANGNIQGKEGEVKSSRGERGKQEKTWDSYGETFT